MQKNERKSKAGLNENIEKWEKMYVGLIWKTKRKKTCKVRIRCWNDACWYVFANS